MAEQPVLCHGLAEGGVHFLDVFHVSSSSDTTVSLLKYLQASSATQLIREHVMLSELASPEPSSGNYTRVRKYSTFR